MITEIEEKRDDDGNLTQHIESFIKGDPTSTDLEWQSAKYFIEVYDWGVDKILEVFDELGFEVTRRSHGGDSLKSDEGEST